MAALASQSDVEESLGRSLTALEEARVARLLDGASFLARDISGRPFVAGTYSVGRIVRADKGLVRLPETATVTEVRAIDYDGTATVLDADSYTVRGKVVYGLWGYRNIEVDYTTTATVPDDVKGAVADMVADVFIAPASSVASQQSGPFAVTYKTTAGTVVADGLALRTLRAYAAAPRAAINLL